MLEILKYPDERLKQISKPVEQFDSKLHDLLDQMATAMYGSNGIGLAAPQVGHFIRAFIIDIRTQDERHNQIYEFINPRLTNGRGAIDFEEGCLSVPGLTEFVKRKAEITIEYQSRTGEKQTIEADGILSVAVQHENDHLDGILFIDKVSPLKRRLIKRRLNKSLVL